MKVEINIEQLHDDFKQIEIERKLEAVRKAPYEYREYHYDNRQSIYELINAPEELPKQYNLGVIQVSSYGDDYNGQWQCRGHAYEFKSREDVWHWLKMVGAKVSLTKQRESVTRLSHLLTIENDVIKLFSSC